jgi:hypothetical protein
VAAAPFPGSHMHLADLPADEPHASSGVVVYGLAAIRAHWQLCSIGRPMRAQGYATGAGFDICIYVLAAYPGLAWARRRDASLTHGRSEARPS